MKYSKWVALASIEGYKALPPKVWVKIADNPLRFPLFLCQKDQSPVFLANKLSFKSETAEIACL